MWSKIIACLKFMFKIARYSKIILFNTFPLFCFDRMTFPRLLDSVSPFRCFWLTEKTANVALINTTVRSAVPSDFYFLSVGRARIDKKCQHVWHSDKKPKKNSLLVKVGEMRTRRRSGFCLESDFVFFQFSKLWRATFDQKFRQKYEFLSTINRFFFRVSYSLDTRVCAETFFSTFYSLISLPTPELFSPFIFYVQFWNNGKKHVSKQEKNEKLCVRVRRWRHKKCIFKCGIEILLRIIENSKKIKTPWMTSYESEVFLQPQEKFEQNTFELKIIIQERKPTTTSITKCTLKRKKRDLIKVEFARWKEQQQVNCETNKKKSLIYQLEWVLCLCSRFQWQSKTLLCVCARERKIICNFLLLMQLSFSFAKLLVGEIEMHKHFSHSLSLTQHTPVVSASHNPQLAYVQLMTVVEWGRDFIRSKTSWSWL